MRITTSCFRCWRLPNCTVVLVALALCAVTVKVYIDRHNDASAAASGTAKVVDEFWPNGNLHVRRSVITDSAGHQLNHGPLSVWYETGEPRSRGYWRYGRKNGHFVFWHKNGRKAKEFTWTDGRGDGEYVEWDEDGNELHRELWCDGKRVDGNTPVVTQVNGHGVGRAASSPPVTPPAISDAGSARLSPSSRAAESAP